MFNRSKKKSPMQGAAGKVESPALVFNMSLRQLCDSSDRIRKFISDRYIASYGDSKCNKPVIDEFNSTGKLGLIFDDMLDEMSSLNDFIRYDEVENEFKPDRVGWLYLAEVHAANCGETLFVISGLEAEAEQFIYTYISTRF